MGCVPKFLVCLALCLGYGPPAGAAPAPPVSPYEQGLRSYRSGDTEAALAHFAEAQRAEPRNPYPVLATARIRAERFYERHLGFPEARDSFQRWALLVASQPVHRDLAEGYRDQGLLLLAGGQPEAAADALTQFLNLAPDHYAAGQAWNALGVAHFRLGRYDEAVSAFRRAAQLDAGLVEARVNMRGVHSRLALYQLARVQHRRGELDGSLATVRRVSSVQPNYLPALRLEGDILRDLGLLDEALCAYQEVLSADHMHPVSHGARLEMARIYEQRGELRRALDLLNQNAIRFRGVENDPTRAEILRLVDRLKELP